MRSSPLRITGHAMLYVFKKFAVTQGRSRSLKWQYSVDRIRVSYCRFIVTMAISCIISEIKRDICRKSRFLHSPPAFEAPIRASQSEYCHDVWRGNTRMADLPDGDKSLMRIICLLVSTQYTNVTDTARRHRPRYTQHRAAKTDNHTTFWLNPLRVETIILPHRIIWSWYTGEEGTGRGPSPPRPLLAVPNVAAHPSTASVPTTYYLMWQYNCLCPLKG